MLAGIVAGFACLAVAVIAVMTHVRSFEEVVLLFFGALLFVGYPSACRINFVARSSIPRRFKATSSFNSMPNK